MNGAQQPNARSEKARLCHKILGFLKERGFQGNLTITDISAPSKQSFIAIFQFMLRQLDVSITLPTIGTEDYILRFFDSLGYRNTISKSILRSFNSPPSWQQSLYLLSFLVDVYHAEEELLHRSVVPPTASAEVPEAVLASMVANAQRADPQSRQDWRVTFQKAQSANYNFELYLKGEASLEEAVQMQVQWESANAQADLLEVEAVDQRIAELENDLKAMNTDNASALEARAQIADFKRDHAGIKSEYNEVKLETEKRGSELQASVACVAALDEQIAAALAERKRLEETIAHQEVDRDQVLQYQSEIDEIKLKLQSVKKARLVVKNTLMPLKEEYEALSVDADRQMKAVTKMTREILIPNLPPSVSPTAWSRLSKACVAPDALIDELRTVDPEDVSPETFLGIDLDVMGRELQREYERHAFNLATTDANLKELEKESLRLKESLHALERSIIDAETALTLTEEEYLKQERLKDAECSAVLSANTSLEGEIRVIDTSHTAAYEDLAQKKNSLLAMDQASKKARHQELKEINEGLRMTEYLIEKTLQRELTKTNHISLALKALVYEPIGDALLRSETANLLRGDVEEQAAQLINYRE